MPTHVAKAKQRARQVAPLSVDLKAFLARINDPVDDLSRILLDIAVDLSAHAVAGTAPPGTRAAYQHLEALRQQVLRRARVGNVSPEDIAAIEMAALVRLYLLGAWEGWRLLNKCPTCGNFFITADDKQQYDRPQCRPSRTPRGVRTRVQKSRAAKRNT